MRGGSGLDKITCGKRAGYYRFVKKTKVYRCEKHTKKGDTKIANTPVNLHCAAIVKP